MSYVWGAGRELTNGAVRFVTRRTALTIAAALACGSSVLALTLGVVIGRALPHGGTPAGQPADNRVARDYTISELGKLDASVAQIEPRVTRLAAQVAMLRDFETRLKAVKALPRAAVAPSTQPSNEDAGDGASDDVDMEPGAKNSDKAGDKNGSKVGDKAVDKSATNSGGPALPPQRCMNAHPRVHTDTTTVGEQLSCVDATLSALESETTRHMAAWEAFPGRMPVDGARFGSPFGNRVDPFTHRLSFHPGIDLVALTGTPILAAAGGRVIYAGPQGGYGNAVEIDHGNGLVTRYGHASRIVVHDGDLVLPYQHVADVGSTGRSTGPHLHFEVLVNGAPVDPGAYLALFMEPSHG
jgi:murein DD-endopeptidase MepM/ murein hydrolase activator NlpD